jgi:thiamine pyrophosphokinase
MVGRLTPLNPHPSSSLIRNSYILLTTCLSPPYTILRQTYCTGSLGIARLRGGPKPSTREPDPDNAGGGIAAIPVKAKSLPRPERRDFQLPSHRRAVIFANGLLGNLEAARQSIRPGDLLIAADGGARHCRSLGLVPQYLVGDFDSLTGDELEELRQMGVTVHQHPAHKDFTDLELALRLARDLGADEMLVLGGLGARWDQTMANLLLPAAEAFAAAHIRLLDGAQEVFLLRAGESAGVRGSPGDTVSLIPLGGDARGVTTVGLEYPLNSETLIFGATRGVSNLLLGESASVRLADGLLLCVVIHRAA